MCGIAGFLRRGGGNSRELLTRMCDRLVHRGPDAFGSYLDDEAALGHRRLSIIDLAGGDQPMGNEDGSVQVVFNGEIYNFQELRKDLVSRAHSFRTRSDTEVLVHLYEEVGERTPEYLNGMFAFAIWDARKKVLFMARDRVGKKPLYYVENPVPELSFAFASELKALMAIPGIRPRLNHESVAAFLALSYVPDPDTIYEGIHKLPPAHVLSISESGSTLRRYWRPRFEVDSRITPEDAFDKVRALAEDAVEKRLVSDVPLGAFLSGGVDSSAVTGVMASKASGPVKTFSIGFTDRSFDELSHARAVARRWNTEHHEEVVTPDIEEMFDDLIDHFDEPFGDSSAIPTMYLARMTRRNVTVALSGDGADELFAGYRRHLFGVAEHSVRRRVPRAIRRTLFRAAGELYPKFDYLPRVFRAKTTLQNIGRDLSDAYLHSLSTFSVADLRRLLPLGAGWRDLAHAPQARFRKVFAGAAGLPPLLQLQWADLELYLPGDILVKADRATMAYSLETRSPWLDYRLVDLACTLPVNLKLNGRTGKFVFKQAMSRYVAPAIANRVKMGFAAPLDSWFRGPLLSHFRELVLQSGMADTLNLGYVRQLVDEHRSGIRNHGRKLWNVLMLAAWMRAALSLRRELRAPACGSLNQ